MYTRPAKAIKAAIFVTHFVQLFQKQRFWPLLDSIDFFSEVVLSHLITVKSLVHILFKYIYDLKLDRVGNPKSLEIRTLLVLKSCNHSIAQCASHFLKIRCTRVKSYVYNLFLFIYLLKVVTFLKTKNKRMFARQHYLNPEYFLGLHRLQSCKSFKKYSKLVP